MRNWILGILLSVLVCSISGCTDASADTIAKIESDYKNLQEKMEREELSQQ